MMLPRSAAQSASPYSGRYTDTVVGCWAAATTAQSQARIVGFMVARAVLLSLPYCLLPARSTVPSRSSMVSGEGVRGDAKRIERKGDDGGW